MSPARRGRKRQSITFTDEAAVTVEKLAAEHGKSVSEIVREAVALESWFQETRGAGRKIYVKDEDDGSFREVEFLT
jgi:hypothetical protein